MAKQITVELITQSMTTTKGIARNHEVLVDRPQSKDGTDLGMMGGEMLLVALGGCFMSNLLEIVRTREANISDIRADVVGTLSEDKPPRFVNMEIIVDANYNDREEIEKFVLMAERACLSANTLKQGFEVSAKVAEVVETTS
jgi:putative redox protein